MTEELPHIRCIECGKVIADKCNAYQELLQKGVPIDQALNRLGLSRYCCRIRMMNPFKVPTNTERQIDPRDTGLERQVEKLTVVVPPTPNPINLDNQNYTVVPATTGIDLPAIPEVALPAIPAPGAEVVPEKPGTVIRTYEAW